MSFLTQFQFLTNGTVKGGRTEPTLGLLVKTNVLTASSVNTAGTYVVGTTTNLIRVRLTGGGGAGGPGFSTAAGGGGGSGGYAEKLFTVTPNTSCEYFVGAGGPGGAGSPGTAGSTTTFSVNDSQPATAAQVTTAVGYGQWSAGYLCDDVSSALAPVFGSTTLNEAFSSGSPAYGSSPGPRGYPDEYISISVAGTGFQAASNSFSDITAAQDLCFAIVFRTAALSTSTYLMSKNNFVGGAGYWLQINADGSIFGGVSDGTVGQSSATAVGSFNFNDWTIVLLSIDRTTQQIRVGCRSLSTGITTVGGLTSISTVGSPSELLQPFRISTAGGLGGVLDVAGFYIGTGAGAATGLAANLSTALSNFAATFTTVIAGGGQGGTSNSGAGIGGAGGRSFNGDLNAAGMAGDTSVMITTTVGVSGRGGSSLFGGGGNALTTNPGSGNQGTGYGGGGGGAFGVAGGGGGASGVIIVEEYAGGVAPTNTGLTLVGVQAFNYNDGQSTYTPTPGATAVLLQAVGGGGGGGGISGAGGTSAAGGAGGGNSGTYIEQWISGGMISGGAVSIGSGGNAGTNAPTSGGAGSDTTIVISGVTYTAGGGAGGPGATTTTAIQGSVPAAQSRSSSACTTVTWSYGSSGFGFNGAVTFSGCGGSSPFGAGGAGGGGGTIGGTGGVGAGGGGGCDWHSATGLAGGPGGNGQIVIYEFA